MHLLGKFHFLATRQRTLKVPLHSGAHGNAFTYVQQRLVFPVEKIAPRRVRNRVDLLLLDIGWQACAPHQLIERLQ